MRSRIPALSLSLLLLAATAACDRRVPPTQSNPTGDPAKVAACTGDNCPEEPGFFHNIMPWNWF